MQPTTIIPYGIHAWLARWEDAECFHDGLAGLRAHLGKQIGSGLVEFTIGYQTVHLRFNEETDEQTARKCLEFEQVATDVGKLHNIPVKYNGSDLNDYAAAVGLKTDEVIALHTAPEYTVYYLGFAPGFPYLGPLDPKLHLPRKAQPRPRIDAGSVAIGGSHTGIYSIPSPGGWHILGHTDTILFHPDQTNGNHLNTSKIFLLSPGDRVRFVAR